MLFWLVIVIILGIIELMTVNLVSIWFIASGIITLIASLFIDNIVVEFAIFVILGIIFMLLTKKIIKNIKPNVKTNLDRIVGMTGIVTDEINKNKNGEVKVDGKLWTAYSDNKIKVGSTVVVLSINSVKLKVKEIKE